MSARSARRRSLGLSPLAALAVALLCEMALVRVAAHTPGVFSPALDRAATFAFYLAALLALVCDGLGTFGLVQDARLFPRGARLGLALCGAMFLPLAAVALFTPLPASLARNMHLSFAGGTLGLVVALALGRARWPGSPARQKIALAVLVAPISLHVAAVLGARAPYRIGQMAALGAGPLAALLYARAPAAELLRGWPAAVGVATAGGLLGALQHPEAFDRVLGAALGLALPGSAAGRAALVLGGTVFAAVVAGLLRRPGRDRAAAAGLLLVAASGYLLELPHHLAATHVGLLVLVRASTWPSAPSVVVGADRWAAYARAVARALGAGDPIVLDDGATTITRIRRAGAVPLDVRIVRRAGEVREVGVTVGITPPGAPPYTAGGEVRPPGVRLARGADALAAFVPEPPRALEDGWLGVWPREAVLFRTFPEAACTLGPVPLQAIAIEEDPAAPIGPLVELVREVEHVAEAAEVRA